MASGLTRVATRTVPQHGPVLTKAALRAADRLGVSGKSLARIVGLSEASVSRMGSGAYTLAPGDKAFELAVMFVRLFRSLGALVRRTTRSRGRGSRANAALDGTPADLIRHAGRASLRTGRARSRLSARSQACLGVVEAQHRVSTMKLVDALPKRTSRIDPRRNETAGAGRVRAAAPALDAVPYGAPYPTSALSPGGLTPASSTRQDEHGRRRDGFHRLLFFADSPATPWPKDAGDYTAFSTRFRARAGLDLARPPFDAERARWTHPTAYGPCQALADAARGASVDALRYPSARDTAGVNVGLLTCRAFAVREPIERQTWRLGLNAHGARAVCDFPDAHLEFTRDAFANDPRIRELWRRRADQLMVP